MIELDGVIRPPSRLLLALETRGVFSLGALIALAPFLAAAPRGAPHAVIVLPGLGATDRSTLALRRFLAWLGYQAHGWGRGRNVRAAGADVEPIAAQIRTLQAATGKPVSLVGWSRGGIIAREATRLAPEAVRMVITLGSPFAAPHATNVFSRWRVITGEGILARSPDELRRLADPLPVPMTSIYSRSDGVVAWRACHASGPQSENVEVRGPHIGLGFNPAAFWVIADRLALEAERWEAFRPRPLVAALFPSQTGPGRGRK